jgi:hypothetical protein
MLLAMEIVLAFASSSTVVILIAKWIKQARTERIVARRLQLVARSDL